MSNVNTYVPFRIFYIKPLPPKTLISTDYMVNWFGNQTGAGRRTSQKCITL